MDRRAVRIIDTTITSVGLGILGAAIAFGIAGWDRHALVAFVIAVALICIGALLTVIR